MQSETQQDLKPIKLAYIIGSYPELTNTFIDREIITLRQLGNINIRIVSIRYPRTHDSDSPEQKAISKETLYLISRRWVDFNFLVFFLANLYFACFHTYIYFRTFIYLFTRPHPNLRARLKTILHFWEGVYAAFLLRQIEIDHLHAHFMDRATTVAMVASLLLNKSYSLTAHAADIYTKTVLGREKLLNAHFAITVSQYNKEYLLSTYPDVQPDKIHVLHPWINLNEFPPRHPQTEHNGLNILSVGRLVEKKGQADIIEACYLLSRQNLDLECRIVGEGPIRPELEKQISRYGLQDRVYLMGAQPQNIVKKLLGTWADVFTLPCVIAQNGDRDGMPVSLAEAMAMELPVISTDIIGIRELVQPGTGILVSPHNPTELAEALRTINDQAASTRLKIGCCGRDVVEKEFNLLKGTEQLAELFYQAVDENRLKVIHKDH
jgi:glycosyltransferase involved in cell wall biosynthesis